MSNPSPWLAALVILALAGCRESGTIEDASIAGTPDSIEVIDVVVGEGPVAEPGKTVSVHFTIWIEGGPRIRSTRDRRWAPGSYRSGPFEYGGDPFVFQIGAGQALHSMDEGVRGMRIGGIRKLMVRSEQAFRASDGWGDVPAGTPLVFEVELMDVK